MNVSKLLSAVLVISFNLMLGCASAPKASYEDDLLMTKVRRLVYDGNFEEARTALSRVRDSYRCRISPKDSNRIHNGYRS